MDHFPKVWGENPKIPETTTQIFYKPHKSHGPLASNGFVFSIVKKNSGQITIIPKPELIREFSGHTSLTITTMGPAEFRTTQDGPKNQ